VEATAGLQECTENRRHARPPCSASSVESYWDRVHRSAVSVVMPGDNPHTSGRLFDAIAAGTPPLIIGDLQSIALPFTSIISWDRLFPIVSEASFFAGIGPAVAAALQLEKHGGPGGVAGFHVCSEGRAPQAARDCEQRSWGDVAAELQALAPDLLWEAEASRVAENVLLQAREQCGRTSRLCASSQNATQSCWRAARLRTMEYMVWKRHDLWQHCALNIGTPPASGFASSCTDEHSCDRLARWLESCFTHRRSKAHGAALPLMMASGLRGNDVVGLQQTSAWLDSLALGMARTGRTAHQGGERRRTETGRERHGERDSVAEKHSHGHGHGRRV